MSLQALYRLRRITVECPVHLRFGASVLCRAWFCQRGSCTHFGLTQFQVVDLHRGSDSSTFWEWQSLPSFCLQASPPAVQRHSTRGPGRGATTQGVEALCRLATGRNLAQRDVLLPGTDGKRSAATSARLVSWHLAPLQGQVQTAKWIKGTMASSA